MSTIRKMQILIAMKFQSLKNPKFYSSEITVIKPSIFMIMCSILLTG